MRQPSEHRSAHAGQRARHARRVLAASIVAAFGHAPGLALAQQSLLPTGPQVVSGSAQISTTGSQMTVVNSRNAVLDWQSFSIGANSGVHFQQADAASKVLNRVVGNDPSSILGSLSSNGEVWLVNPNGVLFGADARIDVGALVASTLGVRNEDFLAGRHRFGGDGTAGGSLVNRSEFSTSFGGRVWLVGGAVSNAGTISTPGGQIVLAAGQSIELVDSGMPNVTVRVSAPKNETVNVGNLLAPNGGSIDLHGAIVNQRGIVRADSIDAAGAGRIVMRARLDLTLASGSNTSADADTAGGQVTLEAIDGTVSVGGDVSATSATNTGGSIELRAGGDVLVDGGIRLDASGTAGGGAVLVSGANTHVGAAAALRANAVTSGTGGSIEVSATDRNLLYGRLDASGGQYGGNGGQIDTSGLALEANPWSVDASGQGGASGTWLLGAGSLRVTDGAVSGNALPGESLVSNTALASALSNGTRVRLVAGGQGTQPQAGDVVVGAGIDPLQGRPGAALMLEARNDVVFEPGAAIRAGGAMLRVTLAGDTDGDGGGAIRLGPNSRIDSGGGNVELRAPRIELRQAAIDASNTGRPGGDTGQVAIAGKDVVLDGSRLDASGAIRIDGAASIGLAGSGLASQAQGDSIVLSTASFDPRDSRLAAPAGRWLVYLDRLTDAFPASQLDQLGYTFVQVGADENNTLTATGPGQHGVIVREGLDVRIHVDADRVYDGSTLATISRAQSSDLRFGLALQQPTLAYQTQFADKHAGAGKRIDYQGGPLFGIVTSTGQSVYGTRQTYVADVARAPVTVVQAAAQDKVYDGNRDAILSGTVSGVVAGDSATLDGALGRFDSKHAGIGKTVVVDGATLVGSDSANYVVSGADLRADIAARAIGNGGLTALDKVYDGTRDAVLSDALQGILQGDRVHLGGATALFEDKNAGAGKTVMVTDAFLAGADAANYLLDSGSTVRASITPRRIEASAMTAQDKVYDGARTANLNGALAGFVAGDNVRLEGSGLFEDRNAGVDKTVSVSDAQLAGADAGNYLFTAPATVHASITARQVSAGALVVQDKVYDGTRDASVSSTLVGLVAGDNVRLDSAIGLFADKNAGTGKTVTLSGGVLAGADARNYSLASGAVTARASIAPRALDASGLAALDKVYDGTRDATLSGALGGILTGDDVVLQGATGLFADKNAGVAKAVMIEGAALGGADAGNYSVSLPAGLRASITPRQITLAGLAVQDKVYDGTRDAQVSATLAGAVAGDAVSFEAAGQFDSKNAGSGKTVAITGTLRGDAAANYALSMPTSASAAIRHRALDIVIGATPRKEYDATTAVDLAPGAFALDGVLAGEALAVRGPVQGQFDSRDVGSDKQVKASGVFEILGADAANYRIGATTLGNGTNRVDATALGSGAITPATLVYNAHPSVAIGALAVGGLGGTVTGFKGNDTLANATSGTPEWHTTAAPFPAPGFQPIFGSGLRATNYVLVQAPGNAVALDVRAGLPPNGPQQRAQDGSTLGIASALQAALPAQPVPCSIAQARTQCIPSAPSSLD